MGKCVKKNWTVKRIEDICEKASSNIAQNKLDGITGDYPVFGASGYVQNVNFYHRTSEYIGIVKDGSGVGRVNLYPAYSSLLGTMQYILPKEGNDIRFIAYALKSLDLASFASGAAIPHIYFKDYGKCKLPVPPRDVQERIVAELNLLNGVLEKQKAQLKELDTLAQSIFYDMFGDMNEPEVPLVDLCKKKDDIKCGPFGTQLSSSEYQKYGVAVWGIPQVNSQFKLQPTDFVTSEKAAVLNDYSVIPGDIVMSRKGNVGQCSVFPNSMDAGIIHSDVLRLRLDSEIANSVFMMYQLHLSDLVKHQIRLVSSGAIMPGINVTKLKSIKVLVPPLPLQQAFAEKISSIEKQKATINQSIAETQKLLDYTMDKYFG